MKNPYSYSVGPQSFKIDAFFDESDLEGLAEECAEDYHKNHEGFEATWPITLFLFDAQGNPLGGAFTVELESTVTFSASEK